MGEDNIWECLREAEANGGGLCCSGCHVSESRLCPRISNGAMSREPRSSVTNDGGIASFGPSLLLDGEYVAKTNE